LDESEYYTIHCNACNSGRSKPPTPSS
jgi:hypothetical protein